jgi:hypothetical protein
MGLKKMPYRSDMQVQFYLGAFGLDLTLPGIRRTILSSRSRHSGPLEPQRGQERPCQADTQTPVGRDLNITSLRAGAGAGAYLRTALSKTSWTTCCEAA